MGRVKPGGYETCGRCGEEFRHPQKIPQFYGGAYCGACTILVALEEEQKVKIDGPGQPTNEDPD